mmetsp:Transcript_14381/g.24492  ORF Transcript_14381/g.24492 Transcript_14381/m.24492 type:complete len:80 (-) Transcript_14381:103-342(-)
MLGKLEVHLNLLSRESNLEANRLSFASQGQKEIPRFEQSHASRVLELSKELYLRKERELLEPELRLDYSDPKGYHSFKS